MYSYSTLANAKVATCSTGVVIAVVSLIAPWQSAICIDQLATYRFRRSPLSFSPAVPDSEANNLICRCIHIRLAVISDRVRLLSRVVSVAGAIVADDKILSDDVLWRVDIVKLRANKGEDQCRIWN
jgi:hypothetical protein